VTESEATASRRGEAGPPEFLVVGHVTRDLVGGEVRHGGTASYAAAVAARLGVRTAILTGAEPDAQLAPELEGVPVYRLPSAHTLTMEHRWYGRRREQYVHTRAATIEAAAVPAALAATPVVLFGPVVGEVEAAVPDAFPHSLRGATLQGWLRRVAEDGHVEPVGATAWPHLSLLDRLDAAFLSEEDLAVEDRHVLEAWATRVHILAVTRGDAGTGVAIDGRWHAIGVFPAKEVDGTGAGDAFAAAFLIRYHQTADAGEAARFAAAVASFMVEAPGIAGAPTRDQVEARLAAFPDVRLRPEPPNAG
jgi:hypothetical protein